MKDEFSQVIYAIFSVLMVILIGLIFLTKMEVDLKWKNERNKFNETYTSQQQCELVEQQVIYTKKWEENILLEIRNMSWYSYSEYVVFTEKQEQLTQQKIQLVYSCSQNNPILAYDFLTSVNKQNHQFYQLNEAYKTTKKIMNEVRG